MKNEELTKICSRVCIPIFYLGEAQKNKLLFIAKIAAFCIILAGCAAKPINQDLEGFLGIAWGANISTAESILSENNFNNMYIGPDFEGTRGIFADGTFMNEDVSIFLLFYNDQFHNAHIRFIDKSNLLERYAKTTDLLTEKYGKPSEIFREHPEDPMPMRTTIWDFRNNSSITTYCYFDSNSIVLWYVNNTISNEKKRRKQ